MPMVKPSISTHKYTTFFINTIKVQVGFWIIPTERGENRPKKHQLQPSLHTPSTLSNNKRPTLLMVGLFYCILRVVISLSLLLSSTWLPTLHRHTPIYPQQ